MKRKIFYALLLLLSTHHIASAQAWEEIYYENFGTGYTGQPLPTNWSQDGNGIFGGNVNGATGGNGDPCRASLLLVSSSYLAYEMEGLSDTYEYFVTMNLKTNDSLGAQLAFYHSAIAEAGGTLIGSPVAVPIIPHTSPGQVVSIGTFSGLNGTHYLNIVKGPTDPSSGNERTRLDDFRLYRRPIGGINSPPSVNILTPTDGDTLTANTDITITATASDTDGTITSVKFYYGTTLISEDSTTSYEAIITGGLAAGTYTLKAVATDDDDDTTESAINITVIAPNVGPTISLDTPSDGTVFETGATINLTATASDADGTVQSVQFFYGTTLIAEDFAAPYSASIAGGLATGSYVLKAVATDDDADTAESSINITVNPSNIGPTVSLDTPSDGAIFEVGTTINLTATASDADGTVQSVQFLYGSTLITEDFTAPYSATIAGGLATGSYVLKAVATDNDGDSTESQITINIQAAPSSDWELIYEENFGTGFSGQPLPPNWEKNIFNGNVEGATGGSDDPCQTSLLRFYSAYLAYKMTLSDSYEYYASMNLKTDDTLGMEIAFYHNPTAASSGTAINSSVAVPIIPANQPGQVVPSDIFGGLNGEHYFIIAKGPNDPSGGDNALRVDDFKLYRRPINSGPTAQCLTIGQGADDAEEWPTGNVKRGQNTIELINDANDGDQLVGLRFDSLMVPPGATVTSAYLQFTAADTNDLDPINLTIRAQASDDPGKFLNVTNDVSSRPLTTASVAWSPPNWNTAGEAGSAQQTTDLSAIVQEIVDRPGYATYNAIAFLINGTGRRSIVAYNDDPDAAAQLCITFDTTTVANVPPTVTLDDPTDGALFVTGNAINLNATANDTDGTIQSVQFYYDNTLIDEDLNAPYAANISAGLAAGTYILKAIATDNDGETAEAQINVTVEAPNVPPSVTIDAPANGAVFEEGETISIAATANDTDGTIQSVQFYYDNTLIDEDLNSPYLANVGAGLTAGTYILKAIATDDDGDTAEALISITVQAPNVAPSIFIINPSDGASYQEGESFTFHAVATDSDGGIQQIDLFEGSTLLHSYTPNSAPYAASHTITGLSIGSYTLRAVATDNEGATAEEVVYITVSGPTVVPELLAFPSTNLGKGDLIFLGFDNDIGDDKDRIIVTNLVELLPETSFMITNANYCREDEHWYSQDSLDGDIPVQRITYQGEDILPAGSAICFDIPADGDFMITDFMIDGNSTDDFLVQNVGQRAIPDINLRKDSTAGHLFLLQGGNWRFRYDFATYTGRSVAPPILYGSTWDDGDCSTGSQLPGADECIAGPSFPTVGGSVYAYFDCSEYGSQYSPFAFMKEAIDTAKWDIEVGTDSLDFSGTACSMDCAIIQDSIYWVFTPDTLIVDCANNYQDSIQQWLANNGNATAGSSCQDNVDITYTYPGLNASACDAGGQPVTFIATDSCGGRVTATGVVQMNISTPLSFDHVAADTTVQCSPDSITIVLQDWIDRHGGATVTNNCLVNWEMEMSQSSSLCGLIDTVWATFHAISVCGDTISTSAMFDVEDNIAPVFVTQPRDTTISCNDLGFAKHLKGWLESAALAEYSDNCTNTSLLDITYDFPPFDGQCGSTLITFTLSDGCGNATTATANLTIEDTAPPVISSFPESYSISIDDTSFQASIYQYLVEGLIDDSSITDFCTSYSDSLRWTHDYAGQLSPGQCDSTLVNVTISDKCENAIDTSLIVYAVDVFAPYFDTRPDTLSISCSISQSSFSDLVGDWKDDMDNATISDTVGSGWTITHTEIDSIQMRCGYYRVQFTVTDNCGNSGSTIGIVEVTDNSPPYFTGGGIKPLYIPYGDTSNIATLNDWLTGDQNTRAADNCTDNLSWSTSSFILPDTSCAQLPVTFYLHDGCNSTIDSSFVYVYLSPLDTISTGDDLIINACAGGDAQDWLAEDAGILVSTPCGEVIDFEYEISGGGGADCGNQSVTFTGITPWGDTLIFTKELSTQDNIDPTFDEGPFNLTVNCADDTAASQVANWLGTFGNSEASDDCEGSITWYRNYETLPLSCGSTTVAFTIEDACGNTTTETATLTVLDQQAPIITNGATPLEIYLEIEDLDVNSGPNTRIEGLIQDWLDNEGGALAVDSSYCQGQNIAAATEGGDCSASLNSFPYTEGFEIGFGDWTELTSNGAWERESGGTGSSNTGPSVAASGNYYLYTEASGHYSETKILEGPCFDLSAENSANFIFQYHMYGYDMGSLALEVNTDCAAGLNDGSWVSIWSATGEQGDQWLSANVSLGAYIGQCLKLRFVGNIGPNFRSDMAIDDLQLIANGAGNGPPASSANISWEHDFLITNYAPSSCDTVSVTFTVQDACGNLTSTQSNIIIIDTINNPIIDVLPEDLILNCNTEGFTDTITNWLANFGYGHANDPQGGDVLWSHNHNKPIVPVCSSGSVTFTATNSCGNSTPYTVDLIIEDDNAPTITAGPPTASTLLVDSDLSSAVKQSIIGDWLDAHVGAIAEDSCSDDLTWENDLSNSVYDQACGTVPVTFTVNDGCGNEASTLGELILYQQSFIEGTSNPLDLVCCAIDTVLLNNWLNNSAYNTTTTSCGEALSWSYSGYDPNTLANCLEQTITFTAYTEYGAVHSFTQQITFNTSACCDAIGVTLTQTGSSGNEIITATVNNCTNPEYTWYIGGKPIPGYIAVTTSSIPYNLYGAGTYKVSVSCEGNTCEISDEIAICIGFDLSLDCNAQLIYHSDHNCQQDLERAWYRDGELISSEGEFVSFDAFGTYTLETVCDGSCFSQASLTLGCGDVDLEIDLGADSLYAHVPGCYPTSSMIKWYIDEVEATEFVGEWTIERSGSGLYRAELSFANDPCTISSTIDVCETFFITISDANGLLSLEIPNPAVIPCYNPYTVKWYLDGDLSTPVGTGTSIIPTVTGIYSVQLECPNTCTQTATYEWVSPCGGLTVEPLFVDNNFSKLTAIVSGGEQCNTLLYTWTHRVGSTYVIVAQDSPLNYYYPPNVTSATGYYSVEVTCMSDSGPCEVSSSTELHYYHEADCDYDVQITRIGDDLCAQVTGDPCDSGDFVYIWERDVGSLIGPFDDCVTISNNNQAYRYKLTVKCGTLCEAYAEYETEACDIGVHLSQNGNTLCANVTGTSCDNASDSYVWRRNGVVIANVVGNCYTPNTSGDYSVEVICTSSIICEATSSEFDYTHIDPCDIGVLIQTHVNGGFCGKLIGGSCQGQAQQYEWSLNGQVVSTDLCYTPTASGFYRLSVTCVTDGNTCEADAYVNYQTPCDIIPTIVQGFYELCVLDKGNSCTNTSTTYQWFLDGQPLVGETNNCHTFTLPGDYTVEISCGTCTEVSPPLNIAPCEVTKLELVKLPESEAPVVSDTIVYLEILQRNFCPPVIFPVSSSNGGKIHSIENSGLVIGVKPEGCYQVTGRDDCPIAGCPMDHSFIYCFPGSQPPGNSSLIRPNPPAAQILEAVSYFDQLNIFPNPTQDEVNITMQTDKAETLQLSFYDANGKIVLKDQVDLFEGQNQLQYQTDNLPEGVYIIRLQTKDELVHRKLMVIKQ